MKLAIYGDVHLTKKMGKLQEYWDESAIQVFSDMYDEFKRKDIDRAICLGDFFDAPRLEAKSVKLVTKILSIINDSPFPTFFLLGNHEIFDDESNILDYLSEYEMITPVTEVNYFGNVLMIPYNADPSDNLSLIENRYVFTHHDIYGSNLAGGKTRANFGIDPMIFSNANYVFNGHVHLQSRVSNIFNVGSLLKSQQGELPSRDFACPMVYYVDTDSHDIHWDYITRDLILPISGDLSYIRQCLDYYHYSNKFIVRVEYTDESELEGIEDIERDERVLKLSRRKLLTDTLGNSNTEIIKHTLDIKELLADYIKKDDEVAEADKDRLINIGLELLEV